VALVLILVLSPVLIRFVMPDCASYRGADCSMMPGDVSGHPASSRAFDTALGVGWDRKQRDEKRQSAGQYDIHQSLLSCRRFNACSSLSFLYTI
jgi:hypothetical protein